jgi:ATP-dependent RNA helicase SUPV3L1/SUV3
VASTVEMLDTRKPVEVAVIDEIQMLADRDRGAAWTAAVCGAPARTVYLVGAPEARRAIEALAERLECPLEVHVLKRKGPLSMEPTPCASCAMCARRCRDRLFAARSADVARHDDGAGPDGGHRLRQPVAGSAARPGAALPRGQGDIVVGTDAIAMGLNLPIQRIVMTSTVKFNGVEEEEIPAALARQIAGRAGRFGLHEEGLVAGYDDERTACCARC